MTRTQSRTHAQTASTHSLTHRPMHARTDPTPTRNSTKSLATNLISCQPMLNPTPPHTPPGNFQGNSGLAATREGKNTDGLEKPRVRNTKITPTSHTKPEPQARNGQLVTRHPNERGTRVSLKYTMPLFHFHSRKKAGIVFQYDRNHRRFGGNHGCEKRYARGMCSRGWHRVPSSSFLP